MIQLDVGIMVWGRRGPENNGRVGVVCLQPCSAVRGGALKRKSLASINYNEYRGVEVTEKMTGMHEFIYCIWNDRCGMRTLKTLQACVWSSKSQSQAWKMMEGVQWRHLGTFFLSLPLISPLNSKSEYVFTCTYSKLSTGVTTHVITEGFSEDGLWINCMNSILPGDLQRVNKQFIYKCPFSISNLLTNHPYTNVVFNYQALVANKFEAMSFFFSRNGERAAIIRQDEHN